MKIKRLLIGMLACSALVACTNDDLLENNELGNKEAMDAFVSVKLVMSDGVYSRATTDGGYEAGTDAERKIDASKSIFLFYDAQGNWVTSGKLVTQTPGTDESLSGDHSTEVNSKYGDMYIALSGPEGELAKSAQVLTVINYNGWESLKQLTLAQALETITNTTADAITETGNFLMTTSTYFEETVGAQNDINKDLLSNTTKIDGETNICATQEEAKKAPVKIYVERASAKVEVKFDNTAYDVDSDKEDDVQSDEANNAQGGDLVVDGNLQPVKITVTGVKLNNVNEDTYLTKRLVSTWSNKAPFTSWNVADNFRSYWAEGTKYNTTSWENVLTSYTYKDATVASEAKMYCYEQTVATPNVVADRSAAVQFPNVPTILVAAKISDVKDNEGKAYTGNLFQYGGIFYTEGNYINLILKQLKDNGYEKEGETDGSYTSIVKDDLTIESDGTLSGIKITASKDATYVKNVRSVSDESGVATYTATPSSVDEINAFLNGGTIKVDETETTFNGLDYVKDAIGYANGQCYYQIPIEHISSSAETPCYGVVRNHWYKLTISGVKHIGEAVFNPDVKIPQIPEKSTEYYMAVQLHVLSWHVVKQDVTLD